MKKTLLLFASLLLSCTAFTNYAFDQVIVEDPITITEVAKEGVATTLQGILMYLYFAHAHSYIMPKEKESPRALTLDIASKGFCAALFGDRAKSFFKTLLGYIAQQTQPVTNAVAEAVVH